MQYLTPEQSKILFINNTDMDRIKMPYFDVVREQYIYCKGDYYKINHYTLWVLQQGKHNLISSLSNVVSDALMKEKEQLVIYFNKFIEQNQTKDDIQAIKKNIKDFYKEYDKKMITITGSIYIKSIIDFFTSLIEDNTFYDKINLNNKYIIPLIDCNYNIQTRKIEPRKPHQYFTKCFFVNEQEFREAKDHKESYKIVDDFFLSIANNNNDKKIYLQKIFGYCLTGDITAQNFFIFYGEGANGKSAVFEIIQNLFCDFCKTLDPALMIQMAKKSSGVASPEMVALDHGTRIGLLSEVDKDDDLNETYLKKISGGDKITYRSLYKNEYKDFISEAKCIILTNHKPNCTADKSMLRRIRYIDFNATFSDNPKAGEIKSDPELVSTLKKELLPSVLRWCLDGAKLFLEEKLLIPESLINENNSYGIEANSFEKFLRDNTDIKPEYKIKTNEIYTEYQAFCREDKVKKPLKKSEFLLKMNKKFNEPVKFTDAYYYMGLQIKVDEPEQATINDLDK
jgi:P4 family phage/plasmid primase-like protien